MLLGKGKKYLLVDGDILLFRVALSAEDKTVFEDQVCHSWNKDYAIQMLNEQIAAIKDKTGMENLIICLSDVLNFRKRLFITYKANRKNVEKPLGLSALREYCMDNEQIKTLYQPELEADDVMGILGTMYPKEASIYSLDKDLKTIPCRQWDFKKEEFWVPSKKEAAKCLYTQVLTGDTVDGYTGIPGIGPKKAERALAECDTELQLFKKVREMYEEYYKDPELAKLNLLAQIGQAKILHASDFTKFCENRDYTYNPYEKFGVKLDVKQEETRD